MVNIEVCIGSACHLKGSYNVISKLQDLIELYGLSGRVIVSGVFCFGKCAGAVCLRVNGGEVESLAKVPVEDFFREKVIPLTKTASA